MSGKLAITQNQVRALCAGAKKAGYTPVVKIGNTLVWLVPEDRAIPEKSNGDVDEKEDFRL